MYICLKGALRIFYYPRNSDAYHCKWINNCLQSHCNYCRKSNNGIFPKHREKLMNKTKTDPEISNSELEVIKSENRKAMLFPLRMIALITVISGLFALIFEVQYFKNASIFVYAFRFFALTVAFWILILSNFEFGKKIPNLLAHLLLFSIILSFSAVIIFIPHTLIINSQVAALTIFTSAIFLTWEIKNQIIVAIYYNLVFGATLLINIDGIYFIQNAFAAVIFILFLSTLSIAAVAIISRFRQEAIIKTVRLIETQKKYRAIFENAIEAMFQANYDGKVIIANASFYKVFYFINDKNNISLSDGTFIKKEEFSRLVERIRLNGFVANFITKFSYENSDENIYKINARVVKDITDQTELIEGSIQDITKQVKADEALRLAKEKAEASDRLKSEFLSTMSHEIRTPLNAVINASEFLKEELQGKLNEGLNSIFQIIDTSSRQIVRTIQLILNLAEVQSGLYTLKNSRFDLYSTCLAPIIEELKQIANNKKVNLILREPIVDSSIVADEYSVNQIFRNLIENGIKYTESGSVTIMIDRNSENKLCVIVKDTGVGIAPDYLPNMFKSFSQEEQGFSRKYGGNGVGLALAKRYCNMNRIDITVDSKKNEGTAIRTVFHNS